MYSIKYFEISANNVSNKRQDIIILKLFKAQGNLAQANLWAALFTSS